MFARSYLNHGNLRWRGDCCVYSNIGLLSRVIFLVRERSKLFMDGVFGRDRYAGACLQIYPSDLTTRRRLVRCKALWVVI